MAEAKKSKGPGVISRTVSAIGNFFGKLLMSIVLLIIGIFFLRITGYNVYSALTEIDSSGFEANFWKEVIIMIIAVCVFMVLPAILGLLALGQAIWLWFPSTQAAH